MQHASGQAFELRVFNLIQEELERERLGLLPSACKVYQGKRYPSKDRGSGIMLDVSIEVTLPDSTGWSILWVWECKDYRGAVGVEDVEELWAKLQQVGGVNVKGGLAISSTLRRGALNFARSKGIAVMRVLPDSQVHWVLNLQGTASLAQIHSEADLVSTALSKADFVGENRQLFGEWNAVPVGGWADLLRYSNAAKQV